MAGVTRLTESISLGRSARRGRGLFATAHLGPGTPLIWDHRPLAATGGEPLGTTDGAKRVRVVIVLQREIGSAGIACSRASNASALCSCGRIRWPWRAPVGAILSPRVLKRGAGIESWRRSCLCRKSAIWPARRDMLSFIQTFQFVDVQQGELQERWEDDARTAMEVARASILEAKDLVNQEVEKCNVAVQEEGSKERLRYADEAIEALATLVDPIEVIKRCPLNALSFPDPFSNDESNGRGAALYDVPSFFNHSCRPNVAVKFSGAVVSFQVAEDAQIEAGEELFISYADDSSIGEALAPPASHQDGTLSSLENFLEWNYGISCRESCSCGKYGHSVKNPEILHATQVHQHRAEKSSAEEDVSLASTDAGASTRVSAKKVERIPSEIREKHAPKSVRTKKKAKKRR